MRMKKLLFSILLTMASAMAMNVSARTIYLDANIWAVDNPKFSAWAWAEGADGAAYEFALVEGTIFRAEIPDDATGIIFLRNDPATFDITNPWNAEWNRAQTGIPADQNLFTITSWEDPWGIWSVYGVTPDPEPVGTRTIYLNANMWNTDGAIFAVHVWNTGEADAADYTLTLVEGNVYKAEIRDDATQAIFLRQNPAEIDPSNVWAGEWNRAQTGIPADQNLFTITSWEDPWGTWSVYGVTPEPEPVGTRTIYLDANMWNTDGAIFAIHVWKNESDATDYNLTHIEGSIYEVEIRDDAPYAIFLRKDPNNVDVNNVWVGEWNRSETTIPNDKDQYRITAWKVDENCTPNETTTCPSAGEWSVYGVTPEPEPIADVIVKVKKPAGWAGLSIWAWGTQDAAWMEQFIAWPGVACSPIGNDWYQFTVKADAWFMFNDGQESTSVQTAAANAPTATCYTISGEKNAEGHHLLVDADCATAGTPSTETVYERDVRVGYYGTICLPFSSNNITGVTLYSIAGQTEDGNGLYLDSESELQAGVPYFFLANSTKLVVTATGESTFTPHADHWYPSGNGLVGYINDGHEEYIPQNLYHYMLKDNGLYQVNSIAIVRSKYAYVNWSDIPTTAAELAPGRQRRVIGAQHTTTGVDNIEQTITPTKILRDGQLLIIRDGQLFTITGQMVK